MKLILRIHVVIAVAACLAVAQAPYTNPVIARPGMHAEVADPFVLKHNGEYWLYTSGDPITAYHSRDLVTWEFVGPVLESSKDPKAWNQADVWAPEVTYRDGRFYLYYTATRKSEDWRVMESERRVGVAVADSPRGPFKDSGKPLTCHWAIDGHVFRDPDTGEDWFFYSYLNEAKFTGAAIVVDRMLGPTQLACKPSLVTRGTEAWEDKDGDPHNGSLRYTNEAPTVIKRDGRYYLIYSAGSWDLPSYAVGYAWSDKIVTGGLDGPGWNKIVPPFLRSTPLVEGPGHNALVKAPNNVDDINVYHARAVPFLEPWNRMPFVDRLYWLHELPYSFTPTTARQAPPDRPVMEGNSERSYRDLLQRAKQFTDFVLEINSHGLGQGAEQTAGKLMWQGVDQHIIRKSGSQWQLSVNGTRLPEARDERVVDALDLRGFTHWAITRFFEERFDSTDTIRDWTLDAKLWRVTKGTLEKAAAGRRVDVALRADAVENYEFRADVKSLAPRVKPAPERQERLGSEAVAGIVAADDGKGDQVLAGFDHDYWPFGRFRVRHVVGGKEKQEIAVPMSRGFLYDQFHTIRVVKQGSGFTFWLDGAEMAALRANIGAARPGVFTDNAQAAFDNVRWKQVVVPQNLVLNGSFETEQWENGKGVQGNPWVLSGTAREHYCCAHTGLRRLLITEGQGKARQVVMGLTPGKYRLYARVITKGDPKAAVTVIASQDGVSPLVRSEMWTETVQEFVVSTPEITIGFVAQPGKGEWAAADDFYLVKMD